MSNFFEFGPWVFKDFGYWDVLEGAEEYLTYLESEEVHCDASVMVAELLMVAHSLQGSGRVLSRDHRHHSAVVVILEPVHVALGSPVETMRHTEQRNFTFTEIFFLANFIKNPKFFKEF